MRTLLLTSLLLATPCLAQDLTHKAAPQSVPVIISNATIHPISAEPFVGTLYFSNGILRSVATEQKWKEIEATVLWEKQPTRIDGNGKHVYPAFIAPYTQLGLTEIQSVRATQDLGEVGSITPEVKACTAFNPDSTLIPVTRRNGVLIAGIFPEGGLVPGQGCAARLDAWTIEDTTIAPRDSLASAGMVLRWPNVRPISAWWMDKSDEDQLKDIRQQLDDIKKLFDTAKNYALARKHDPSQAIDLRWEQMVPIFFSQAASGDETQAAATDADKPKAKNPTLPVFIHAQDADQIASAVSFCAELNIRCVIVGGRDAALVSELLKKNDVSVIVTGAQNMPRRDDSATDDGFTVPKRLYDAGVRFTIATSDDTAHERNLPYVAATAVAHGLPVDAALRALTIDAATVLGIDDRYGSLEVGKSASLIVTQGDPLQVTSDVIMAFLDGRQVDLSNKQTKLTEKYLDRYKQKGDLK
ncbi:MAG: amidohydrolase family protein [Phycisphaerales bacterium]